ncbi:MAG: amidohydrolase [Sphingomonadaceae bacterium]|nr:amidohydrolase [Sphingomonadaceae bacterium]
MNIHSKPTSDSLQGLKIIDVDTHITEWADLWTSRATPKYKDRVPRVKMVDGKPAWFLDDHDLATPHAYSAIRKDGSKALGNGFREIWHSDAHDGASNVKARLEYMDGEGIAAQIGYTNLLGFGGQKGQKVDADLRLVSTQILNDAMAEMQAESGNRICPMIMIPWWDIDLAVAEAIRGADMGMRGINMNSDPNIFGVPHLGDPYWNPLWDVCVDRGLPVNFHIGASDDTMTWFGSGQWPGYHNDVRLAFGSVMMFVSNMRVMINILLSRFLENYPDLKIVSVESGAGWVPFMLEALEYQLSEAGPDFAIPVREVFNRQLYATVWFEQRNLVETIGQIGADNVMVETDFPHPTCLYPDARGHFGGALDGLAQADQRKVLFDNAKKLYNLDV